MQAGAGAPKDKSAGLHTPLPNKHARAAPRTFLNGEGTFSFMVLLSAAGLRLCSSSCSCRNTHARRAPS